MNGQEQTPNAAPSVDTAQTGLFDTSDFDSALANDIATAAARHPEPPPLPTPGEPSGENVNAQAPAAPAPAVEAPAAAAPAQPSAQAATAAPAAAAPAAAEAAPAVAPAAQAPEPKSADQEVLDLGADIKLERSKVREVLQQYPTLYQNYVASAQEATKFQQIFKMDAARAEQTWGPLITDVEADPGLADYMQQAWDTYRGYRESNPVSNAEKMAADANKRTQQLEQESQQRRVRELQQMVDNEKRGLQSQYPFLQDADLWKIVAQHSMVEAARDNTYTLTRGVQDLLPVLQRMAQNNAPAQPAATPVAATPEAPALLTGSGASPNGSAGTSSTEEKQFANLDEAAEDWIRNRRSLGFT